MHELQRFRRANPHLSDPSVETYDAKACPDPIGHDCPNDGLSPQGAPGHDVLVPQSRGLDGSDAQGPFWVCRAPRLRSIHCVWQRTPNDITPWLP